MSATQSIVYGAKYLNEVIYHAEKFCTRNFM